MVWRPCCLGSADGELVGLGGSQGKVLVFSTASLDPLHSVTTHGLAVTSLAFADHANGICVISGSADRSIAVSRVRMHGGTCAQLQRNVRRPPPPRQPTCPHRAHSRAHPHPRTHVLHWTGFAAAKFFVLLVVLVVLVALSCFQVARML